MSLDEALACVGAGWAGLVREAYAGLPVGAVVDDVKEKYGGLRIYLSMIRLPFEDVVDEIERRSMRLCEVCGQPGALRALPWIKTLCEAHYQERRKE